MNTQVNDYSLTTVFSIALAGMMFSILAGEVLNNIFQFNNKQKEVSCSYTIVTLAAKHTYLTTCNVRRDLL